MAFTSLNSWRPWLVGADDIPTDFLMSWIRVESYGNPCAVGIPGVEAGIAQTYHPDDNKFGATFAQLRTNCNGNKEIRALTDDERRLQAKVLLALVRSCRDRAHAKLHAVEGRWPEASADFWALAKLWHGLPGIVNVLLPEYKAKNGHAPASFADFRAFVEAVSSSDATALAGRGHTWVPRFRSEFPRIMRNAYKTADGAGYWMAGGGQLASWALFLVPGLGVLAKLLGGRSA